MHRFLLNNRDELIARCKTKVARRPHHDATEAQLANGVPLFLDQLTRTLLAEQEGEWTESAEISGPSGGDVTALSEMGVSATAHGKQLLELGFPVDQVVHAYGDLCQSITDLAVERDAPFSVDTFRTLNRCLDNAIADAVTAFAVQRDALVDGRKAAEENEKLGYLAHELRNHLNVSLLSFAAIESGRLSISGSTGAMMKRSLQSVKGLIDQTLSEVRRVAYPGSKTEVFQLAAFIAEAENVARLCNCDTGCTLWVPKVDPRLALRGSRELLAAALGNLLQNAFKFTAAKSEITLHAYASADRILIEVRDHCGGLPPKMADKLFTSFTQGKNDGGGVGLGLSIAAQSVKADGGTLTARDVPGVGCVFTMNLPEERWNERLHRVERRKTDSI